MRRVEKMAGVRELLEPLRGGTIGLVPTMGALHGGHAALFAAARAECDTVVASVFLNPTQFDDPADLEAYPADPDADDRLAEEAGVDIVFAPPLGEMYPEGFQTWVDVTEISRGLEGAGRPGHFRAVATVCTKLFVVVRPDRAYFGQKDAQQAAVVRRLVRDLALDLEIRVVATVRDADGVALSSRNACLSQDERTAAARIPQALAAGREAHLAGANAATAARAVLDGDGRLVPEYVQVARFDGEPLLLAAAVRIGATRLIDNVVLEGVDS